MIKFIIGLLLILFPFLLMEKFEDKRKGFIVMTAWIIVLQLLIALITQTFHLFNYPVIIIINLIIDAIILIKLDFENLIKSFKIIKIDWMLVIVIVILFMIFYSIHYNYTGSITTEFNSSVNVKNINYPYPYFSDEWSSIALVKYSIDTGKLPFANPLWYDRPFLNFTFPFHSFLSEIFLILNLNIISQYVALSLFINITICLLVYFFLRLNAIDKFSSALAALSVPYITNGANLPGIWTLIPITLGIVAYLLMLCFISIKEKKYVLFFLFISILFYPPIIIFSFTSFLAYILIRDSNLKNKLNLLLILFIIISIATLIILAFLSILTKLDIVSLWQKILDHIFFIANPSGFPNFTIWNIIPKIVLLFSLIGIFALIKKIKTKLWLISALAVGITLWIIYSITIARFIISYERCIFTEAILLIITAGFGFRYCIQKLENFEFIKRYKILTMIKVLILILLIILSFSYTQRTNWKKLDTTIPTSTPIILHPASPANNYILEEDIHNFDNIIHKNILSTPWKSMIIAIITNNYAITTKDAQLNTLEIGYSTFINANCTEKEIIAQNYRIDYLYTTKFECPKFIYINKTSSEGLYLYKFEY